jgi:PAS domain S-box-containing protein
MQPTLKQFSIVAGFALLGLLLLGNAAFTKHRLDVQTDDAEWALHSRQVIVELQQVEATLVDAETGQRGYLLTGDTKYLTPYDRATAQLGLQLDNLTRLTADNPAQQEKIVRVRALAREKMDVLAQTVDLYRAGNAEQAIEIVLSDNGLLLMDQLRTLFAEMQLEETRLDRQRDAEYRQSIRTTAASIWLATLTALLGLAALGLFIQRAQEQREKHAQQLRASEELFRTTLTSIGDAVIATDKSGNVTFLNPVAEKLTGIPLKEAAGKSISQVFPILNELTGKPVEDPVRKVMELGIVVGLANHTVLKQTDGALIPIEDSAAPIRDDRGALIGVVLVFRDVTSERKSEEVLRKTEKLAAAARLSATVAHEINNPLAAVVNLIFIAKNAPGAPDFVVQQLAQAEHELERVAHITRQTLAFYRESGSPERVEIPALVESVVRLYSNKLAAKNIKVETAFENCAPIEGVLGELRQAMSNLIANAIDAVDDGGTISVKGCTLENGEEGAVEVVVSDDGRGIAAENADRIFEPFFTTKKDVGTGLGLWATKTIIERHGGSIAARARNGASGARGAEFAIQLPRLSRIR